MSITHLGSGEVHSQVVLRGGTVYLCSLTNTDRTLDVSGKTHEVIARIEDLFLKYGSEKSKMIAVASYLMEIALNPVMNEKWWAWPGELKHPPHPHHQQRHHEEARPGGDHHHGGEVTG